MARENGYACQSKKDILGLGPSGGWPGGQLAALNGHNSEEKSCGGICFELNEQASG
jgi:hypothetical protein